MIKFDIVGCKVNNFFLLCQIFFDWDLGDGLHEKNLKNVRIQLAKNLKTVYICVNKNLKNVHKR